MDIYCSNCDQNIGLQTNEEYDKMFDGYQKLKKENETLKRKLLEYDEIMNRRIVSHEKLLSDYNEKIGLLRNIKKHLEATHEKNVLTVHTVYQMLNVSNKIIAKYVGC